MNNNMCKEVLEGNVVNNLDKAMYEYDNNNVYSAHEYIIKAYEDAIESRSNLTLKVLLVDAALYIKEKLYNKAYEILTQVFDCSKEGDNYFFEATLELSKLDIILKQERRAISKLNIALKNINETNMNEYWNKLCQILSYAYKQLDEHDKADEYFNMIIFI